MMHLRKSGAYSTLLLMLVEALSFDQVLLDNRPQGDGTMGPWMAYHGFMYLHVNFMSTSCVHWRSHATFTTFTTFTTFSTFSTFSCEIWSQLLGIARKAMHQLEAKLTVRCLGLSPRSSIATQLCTHDAKTQLYIVHGKLVHRPYGYLCALVGYASSFQR